MRARTHSAVLLTLLVTGCHSSAPESTATVAAAAAATPGPTAEAPLHKSAEATTPTPGAVAPSRDQKESSAPELKDLFSALGLGRDGGDVPEGLVAGGDCPPAPADAAAEMAAQSNAAIPLKEGLTLTSMWRPNSQEEYECLMQVTKVAADDVWTTLNCNAPGRKPTTRRICRSDLRSAAMLHTQYGTIKVIGESGKEEPEIIVGATAFSLSSEQFARLKSDNRLLYHFVQFSTSGALDVDEVGELGVKGRRTATVIVNDKPLPLSVIELTGTLKSWNRGKRNDSEGSAVVLDDERFPMLVDVRSQNADGEFRLQYEKITYPGEAGRGTLEGALLENNAVDVYGIYFDFNSDVIRPESEPVLKEIDGIMKRHPDWRLSIAGHTDNVGGNGEYNLQLSRKRSEAVRTTLINRFGISADRLTSNGYGAGAPKDTNDTSEGRARNRRVELVRQ